MAKERRRCARRSPFPTVHFRDRGTLSALPCRAKFESLRDSKLAGKPSKLTSIGEAGEVSLFGECLYGHGDGWKRVVRLPPPSPTIPPPPPARPLPTPRRPNHNTSAGSCFVEHPAISRMLCGCGLAVPRTDSAPPVSRSVSALSAPNLLIGGRHIVAGRSCLSDTVFVKLGANCLVGARHDLFCANQLDH